MLKADKLEVELMIIRIVLLFVLIAVSSFTFCQREDIVNKIEEGETDTGTAKYDEAVYDESRFADE